MNEVKNLIYHFVSFIPKGKVITYGQIDKILKINSPRLIGQFLHQNKNPKKIPCHRVVFTNGSLSKNYAFGGLKKQKKKLIKEGVKFENNQIKNLENHLWQPNKVFLLYFQLLKRFGFPGPWPWFHQGPSSTKEEIMIGAILTQNTNWNNVEKALSNLRKHRLNSLQKIFIFSQKNLSQLEQYLRPSGFYRLKTKRLINLIKNIFSQYQSLDQMKKQSINKLRQFLLLIKGVGQETADTILLYVLDKPIFVIDRYTQRFTRIFFNKEFFSYEECQKFFMNNLPKDLELFKNYHALIVEWGKNKKNHVL